MFDVCQTVLRCITKTNTQFCHMLIILSYIIWNLSDWSYFYSTLRWKSVYSILVGFISKQCSCNDMENNFLVFETKWSSDICMPLYAIHIYTFYVQIIWHLKFAHVQTWHNARFAQECCISLAQNHPQSKFAHTQCANFWLSKVCMCKLLHSKICVCKLSQLHICTEQH